MGLCLSGTVCINNSLLREYFDPKIAGTSIGMGNFLCYLATCIYQNVSSAIIPKAGHVEGKKDTYLAEGYRNGLWIFCLVSTVGATVTSCICKDTIDLSKESDKESDKDKERGKDENDSRRPIDIEAEVKVQQEEINPEIRDVERQAQEEMPGEKQVELQNYDKLDIESNRELHSSQKTLKLHEN